MSKDEPLLSNCPPETAEPSRNYARVPGYKKKYKKKTRKEKKNERRRNQYARVRRYKITSTLGLLVRGDPQNEGLRGLQPRALGSKLDYFHAGITSTRLHRHRVRCNDKLIRFVQGGIDITFLHETIDYGHDMILQPLHHRFSMSVQPELLPGFGTCWTPDSRNTCRFFCSFHYTKNSTKHSTMSNPRHMGGHSLARPNDDHAHTSVR